MRILSSVILSSVFFLVACSVARYTSKDIEPNLTITVETDLNVPLSRLDTMLDVHLLKPDCEWDFQGRVFFDDKKSMIALPLGKALVLQTLFITTGIPFINNHQSDLRYDTLFAARSGQKYLMEIIYKNKIFSAEIFELTTSGKKARQVERIPPNSCKPV